MDETTMERVLAWEANTIDFNQSMLMVISLSKAQELWVLKGEAGKLACIEMMRDESDGKN